MSSLDSTVGRQLVEDHFRSVNSLFLTVPFDHRKDEFWDGIARFWFPLTDLLSESFDTQSIVLTKRLIAASAGWARAAIAHWNPNNDWNFPRPITLVNASKLTHHFPGSLYIGRTPSFGGPSVLANDWSHLPVNAAVHQVATGAEAMAAYKTWMEKVVTAPESDREEKALLVLQQLAERYKRGDSIVLECHCVDQSTHENVEATKCHGQVVIRAIRFLAGENS